MLQLPYSPTPLIYRQGSSFLVPMAFWPILLFPTFVMHGRPFTSGSPTHVDVIILVLLLQRAIADFAGWRNQKNRVDVVSTFNVDDVHVVLPPSRHTTQPPSFTDGGWVSLKVMHELRLRRLLLPNQLRCRHAVS